MRGSPKVAAFFLGALALLIFLVALSAASHEPVPDMEHGESVTAETPFVPSKVGGGGILFKVKDAGDAFFSHDGHVEGAGLKCTGCHDALYITTAKSVAVTMKDMRKGKSCGACHEGKKAFDLNKCGNCHKK
jgi:c(7)-type cytochrome triheme protein